MPDTTPNPARGIFVTGTDTGVGKTWVAAGLLRLLQQSGYAAQGIKPVASGCDNGPQGLRNEDALLLQQHSTRPCDYDQHNPYAFELPVAPHIAAAETGIQIDFDTVGSSLRALTRQGELAVMEGVGGWRVPLGADSTVADLAAFAGFPVLLVVGLRLGCINHAVLSAQAVSSGPCRLMGWIANQLEPGLPRGDEVLEALQARVGVPLLGRIPFLPRFQADAVAGAIDAGRLLRQLAQ